MPCVAYREVNGSTVERTWRPIMKEYDVDLADGSAIVIAMNVKQDERKWNWNNDVESAYASICEVIFHGTKRST